MFCSHKTYAALVVACTLVATTHLEPQQAQADDPHSFGHAATDAGYSIPGVSEMDLSLKGIDILDGIQSYTAAEKIHLYWNAISSIESGDFSGLTNLQDLDLAINQISSIESGAFSDLASLQELRLYENQVKSVESFSG